MKQDIHHTTAEESDAGTRLDKFLSTKFSEFSRSRVQALIDEGHVFCDGKKTLDASAKVKAGQQYEVHVPEAKPSHIVAQNIPLDIVYEDAHLLVLNKPAGLTVHPAPGHADGTLVNALLAHCGSSLSGIGGVARPGIVHRIDKETSGLLVVAKHDAAHTHLSAQLSDRTLGRTYLALVWGTPKTAAGTITGNIGRSTSNRQKMAVLKTGGRTATTHYKVIKTLANGAFSLVECKLETGRTHQIRVHFAHIGNPLVGDPVYGQSTSSRLLNNPYKSLPEQTRAALSAFKRQALHARELHLVHPHSLEEMSFSCEIAEDLQELISVL